MNEQDWALRRELECCTHEAAFGEDVYRSEDHWRRAGSPYEIGYKRQFGTSNPPSWPMYYEMGAGEPRWTEVPKWSQASQALILIEVLTSERHALLVNRPVWSARYHCLRVNEAGRWAVMWVPGWKTVAEAAMPGIAVCLAVLRRTACYLASRRGETDALSLKAGDEAVEQFRPFFTFEPKEAAPLAEEAATPTHAGLPCLFPVEECEIGHFTKYEWLLEAGALIPSWPLHGRQLLVLPSGAVFEQQGAAGQWGWKRIAYGGRRK